MMTAKELADLLTGRDYGGEIFPEEERRAKACGLVAVYGYSDDNIELRGAIDEEIGAWKGTRIYVNKDGVLQPDCSSIEECVCPYFDAAKRAAKTIDAIWHSEGRPCWTFKTLIPHEAFTIFDGEEPFCEGIVFSMKDVQTKTPNDPLTLEELREMDGISREEAMQNGLVPADH